MKAELSLLKNILIQNSEKIFLYLKEDYFIFNTSKELFKYIRNYYLKYNKLPSIEVIQFKYDEDIFEDIPEIDDLNFLFNFVIDRYKRNYFYDNLFDIIEKEEFEEQLIKTQNLILELAKIDDDENEDDLTSIDEENKNKRLYPSGIFMLDTILGGFANSELHLFSGYRGTGKSLLLLNIALNSYQINNDDILFLSIEMKNSELINRLDSMISGINPLKIKKGELTNKEKIQILVERSKIFKKEKLTEKVYELDYKKAIKEYNKLENKPNKFRIIDCPSLTASKIIYYLKKYPNTKMLMIDYLNILKSGNKSVGELNWEVQIEKANSLKYIAREFDIRVISVVQSDEKGRIRFAQGLADAVDGLYNFQKDGNILNFTTQKIRNGIDIDFQLRLTDNLRLVEV